MAMQEPLYTAHIPSLKINSCYKLAYRSNKCIKTCFEFSEGYVAQTLWDNHIIQNSGKPTLVESNCDYSRTMHLIPGLTGLDAVDGDSAMYAHLQDKLEVCPLPLSLYIYNYIYIYIYIHK